MLTAASRRSGSWGRAALAAAALLAAVAAAAAFLLLQGDDDASRLEERRAAVAGYITSVNMAQQELAVAVERVGRTYNQLDLKPEAAPRQLAAAEEAEATLEQLRARLAALPAPVEATALRAKLLRLVDLQLALAREVTGLVRFLPAQAAAGRELVAVTNRLRQALAVSATPAAQRTAFERYRRELRAVVSGLEHAAAPAVLATSRRRELTRLRSLGTQAGAIADALERQEADELQAALDAFVRTSTSTGTTAAQRQAVLAFNRRSREIGRQARAVATERARLDVRLR
jgi:hypothetical protein